MIEWWRSWHGAPMDHKWTVVARKAGCAPGTVAAIVWALFDHASQADERGNVSGFDVETYSAWSGFDEEQIQRVIDALRAKDVIGPDGTLTNWSKRQPKREDETAAERQRRRRDRQKGNGTDPDGGGEPDLSRDVTQRHAASQNLTPREDTEKRREDRGESPPYPPQARAARAGGGGWPPYAFERFWEAFPNRVAEPEARRAFQRAQDLYADEISLDELVAAARRYVPTTTHPLNPATWLRGARWRDAPAAPSAPPREGAVARFIREKALRRAAEQAADTSGESHDEPVYLLAASR